MVRTCLTAVVLVLLFGTLPRAQNPRPEQKDPPRHLEGIVKQLERSDGGVASLTVTVKELKPTDQEDMMREVNTDYHFRLTESTLIFGLDGKPDRRRFTAVEPGARVRVEYQDDQVLEVKRLPPR